MLQIILLGVAIWLGVEFVTYVYAAKYLGMGWDWPVRRIREIFRMQ